MIYFHAFANKRKNAYFAKVVILISIYNLIIM